jgi:hypothetical protein
MEPIARTASAVFCFLIAGPSAGCGGNSSGATCDDAWTRAAATCSRTGSNTQQHQEFLQLCNSPQSVTGCQSQASALAACFKQAATFVCDSTGQVHAVGCDAQAADLLLCQFPAFDMDGGTEANGAGMDSGTEADAGIDVGTVEDTGPAIGDGASPGPCDGSCLISFASGPDWSSFAGTLMPDDGSTNASYTESASLGPAKAVCQNASTPPNCPVGAVVYGLGGGGWAASIPQAEWIWRADVVVTAPADLQIGVFEKTFELGVNPTGLIQIAADDFAQVFVNGIAVGSVGSITDIPPAGRAQSAPTTFDLTPALHTGTNKITVVGQNGPASFLMGSCGAAGCSYSQNPAGVDFAGTMTSR